MHTLLLQILPTAKFFLSYVDMMIWIIGIIMFFLAIYLYFRWNEHTRVVRTQIEHLERIRRYNADFELMLQALKLSSWTIDARTRRVTYNADYRERYDCYVPPVKTPIDSTIEFIHEVDRERVVKALDDICTGAKNDYHEIYRSCIGHTDNFYWSESYASVSERDDEGKPLVIVGISKIVDEQKKLEQELIEARNKAEESDRLKASFLANISHEIRTPLNAIIGFSDILPTVTDPQDRDKLISLIRTNNQQLLHIINDMVKISTIEAGDDTKHATKFDLNLFLQELVDKFNDEATAKHLVMLTEFPMSQLNITTDSNRLSTIMSNFVNNALKFTFKGSITLGYDILEDSKLRVWVRDTGKGIAEKDLNRIFQRFSKVDDFVVGSGLGLAVCRTLAHSLNGHIDVKSTLGEGSTFWIEMPLG